MNPTNRTDPVWRQPTASPVVFEAEGFAPPPAIEHLDPPTVFRLVFRLVPDEILLLLDESGQVQAWNRAAATMMPHAPTRQTCCELLGCNGGKGALADACLLELVRAARDGLVELTIAPPGNGRSLVHATVAAVGERSPSSWIVVQLRETDPSEPVLDPAQPSVLRINALGATRVSVAGESRGGPWLGHRQGEILKYLVCHRGNVVTVEQIATAIWPDADRRAVDRVRYFIHELRDRFEPDRLKGDPSSFIATFPGGYRLNLDRVSIDLDDFEVGIAAGLRAQAEDRAGCGRDSLISAIRLYSGELFADTPYLPWVIPERDRLRDLAANGLRALVELSIGEGDLEEADRYAEQLAKLEPFDIAVQRQLIGLALGRSRRTQAFRRYSSLRMRWLHDFGETLDFELDDVRPEGALPGPPGELPG